MYTSRDVEYNSTKNKHLMNNILLICADFVARRPHSDSINFTFLSLKVEILGCSKVHVSEVVLFFFFPQAKS